MPAAYHGEVEKFDPTSAEYWVNRYYIDAADLVSANNVLVAIAQIERAVTVSTIVFTKTSVRTNVEGDYAFITTPLNVNGQVDIGTSQIMPLFVVARFDFQASAGRPSRKYLRGVLREDMVNGMKIETASVSFLNNNYGAPMNALAGYVDVQGQELTGGVCSPITGMRQLRRGSKKKVIPS